MRWHSSCIEARLQAPGSSAVPAPSSVPLTQGRAQGGSLHSSTLLWDPGRCSRAARSVGKTGETTRAPWEQASHSALSTARLKRDCCQTTPCGAWTHPSPATTRLQGTFCNAGGSSTQNANEEQENGHVLLCGCFFLRTLVNVANHEPGPGQLKTTIFFSNYFKSD